MCFKRLWTQLGGRSLVNLLAIGLDETIAKGPKEASGDAYQRQLKYASILESYHIIVRTLDRANKTPIQLADNFWVYPTSSANKISFVWDAIRIGSQICEGRQIDVISTQDPFTTALAGYILKRRYNIPLSIQFAGDMVDNPYWLKEKWFYPLMNTFAKWLIRRGDTFRVVSIREKEKLMGMGIPENKIWNLGWISDFSRFIEADGSELRRRYLGNKFSKLVLFVGRLVPQKDLPNLLNAFSIVFEKHPDALLLIVGGGDKEGDAKSLARQLGIDSNVIFTGPIPYDQIPSCFAACDLFVLPSVYEGNARVLAEAAAAGKPVVATDVSGTQDTVIDGETGYIVSIRQAEALAQGIIRLLDNPARAAEMGRRAREHILA
ncbi:MAG TPA: glycosyltransferase family 1 protein, partial [Desulfobacterales bacterium]|nr:glycosyltransferase family 1 protein [Desulfobacterales bacterium]